MNPNSQTVEALEHVQVLCDFAFRQGFHELGYDPVRVLREALQAKSDGPADDGWIPIGERLPSPYQTVLLNCDGELRSTGYVNDKGKFSVDAEDLSDGSAWIVTHWHALLDSPKKAAPQAPGTDRSGGHDVRDTAGSLPVRPSQPAAAASEAGDDARDAARYRRLRENWIECGELQFRGRLAVIDKHVDAAIATAKGSSK